MEAEAAGNAVVKKSGNPLTLRGFRNFVGVDKASVEVNNPVDKISWASHRIVV
jgi:hypothetical protein